MEYNEIIKIINTVEGNELIQSLKKICSNTKFDVQVDYTLSKLSKVIQVIVTVAIIYNNDIVMYYPKNNDYDKSMGLIANTSIYEFNYKTKKMFELLEDNKDNLENSSTTYKCAPV